MNSVSKEILKTAKLLMDGQPAEVRIISEDRTVQSGVFSSPKRLTEAALEYDGDANVYITLNPVKVKPHRLRSVDTDEAVHDADIERIQWVGIDIDHDPKQKVAREIAAALTDWIGFPEAVLGSSGTGSWLLYRVDQENTRKNTELRRRFLQALKRLWPDHVDTSVFNASRIVRLFGTVNLKNGRRSRIVSAPDDPETVSDAMLRTLADLWETEQGADTSNELETIEAALAERGIEIVGEPKPGEACTFLRLSDCPFHPDETHTTAAFLMEFPDGGINFRCLGGRCQEEGYNIRDLLDELDIEAEYGEDDDTPRPMVLSRRKPKELSFAFDNRLVKRYCNLVIGEEDVGKGLLSSALISRITRGEFETDVGPQRVLILSTEDDIDSVIVPRLTAAGADLEYAMALGLRDLPRLPRDADKLRRIIERRHVNWVWFDPLNAFIEGDYNRSQVVNAVLNTLTEMAAETACTIVGNLHTNREKTMSWRQKVAHQLEFARVARSAVWVARLPALDDDERALFHVKHNYSAPAPTIRLTISTADNGMGEMELGEVLDGSDLNEALLVEADPEVAAKEARKTRSRVNECAGAIETRWIELDRPDGAWSSRFKEALAGYDKKVQERARKKLGVTSVQRNRKKTGKLAHWWDFTDVKEGRWE